MDRPEPEQLEALRRSLPSFADAAAPSDELRNFLAYYQLDFAAPSTGVHHQCGVIESGSFKLATHRWLLDEAHANLVIVHGYFDHTGLFNKLIQWGLDQGYNVLAFDLPGHGLSSGEPAAIDDFGDYARALHDVLARAHLPDLPLYGLAQSTGCAALTEFARRYSWPFSATVFLAPLIRPANWRMISASYWLVSRLTDSVARGFARNSGDHEFLEFVRQDPLQSHRTPLSWVGALKRWLKGLKFRDLGVGPVLVIQGEADGTVWWRYNMARIPKLYPGSEIFYIAEAGHQLANETPDIRQRYLEKISLYLQRPVA